MSRSESTRYPRELLEEVSTDVLQEWKSRIEEKRARLKDDHERIDDVLEEREDG